MHSTVVTCLPREEGYEGEMHSISICMIYSSLFSCLIPYHTYLNWLYSKIKKKNKSNVLKVFWLQLV